MSIAVLFHPVIVNALCKSIKFVFKLVAKLLWFPCSPPPEVSACGSSAQEDTLYVVFGLPKYVPWFLLDFINPAHDAT